MSEIYEVVIVGADPSGSTTAYYLAKQGFKVLLVDKFNFPRDKTCGDGLTPRALHILNDMGFLDNIILERALTSGANFIEGMRGR